MQHPKIQIYCVNVNNMFITMTSCKMFTTFHSLSFCFAEGRGDTFQSNGIILVGSCNRGNSNAERSNWSEMPKVGKVNICQVTSG